MYNLFIDSQVRDNIISYIVYKILMEVNAVLKIATSLDFLPEKMLLFFA
jgi:hypothetical protein